MKRQWSARQIALYGALLLACLAAALAADFTILGTRIDNYAYDVIYRLFPPADWATNTVVLAIDDRTFQQYKGVGQTRAILADALEMLADYKPAAVAIDVILADESNEATDARLEAAMSRTPNLALSVEVVNRNWELPIERFRKHAARLGHVHPEESQDDGICRRVPLTIDTGAPGVSYLPLGIPDFRTLVPPPRGGALALPDGFLRIRYRPGGIPTFSVSDLKSGTVTRKDLSGKHVFVGVTSLSGRRDQVATPLGGTISGVLIHAYVNETYLRGLTGRPLLDARPSTVLLVASLIAFAAGAVFFLLSGWPAYLTAALILLAAHAVPVAFFNNGFVFPFFASFGTAWLSVAAAATYQHFAVRRQLGVAESDRERYQQAIHMVAHEMRSPLTAIQGSSEMMGRYNLTEEKRKQIAGMINSESKRLAKMIQTFLDVERLSAGQMELKREPFALGELVRTCVERAKPLAERKNISIEVREPVAGEVLGDRELVEYALYNLLTNAVKYSPADTQVVIAGEGRNGSARLSVQDQGIGMDEAERKNLFRKFYRTEKAEKSGEVGTGIGLSLVKEIVTQHGGTMEVTSSPGKGSCFAMLLPVYESRPESREGSEP